MAEGFMMLREVAKTMQRSFDTEHTYRIGGDEFVAFQMDGQSESVYSEVEQIAQSLGRKGYHVSFGISVREKEHGSINMREMVREAENGMFSAKREFYRQPENNRRDR